jgi:hypothetical protein
MNYGSYFRRIAFLTLMAFCFAVIFLIGKIVDSQSRLATLSQVLAGCASVLFFAGVVISDRRWQSLAAAVRTYLTPRTIEDSRRLGQLLIAVSSVCYLSILSNFFFLNDSYQGFDEEAYLISASNADARGGPTNLVGDLYGGGFTEANRHPLYIGMLSIKPTFRAGNCSPCS